MSQSATFPGETSDSGIANKSCKYLKLLHFLVKYRSSPQKHPCSTCKRSPHWTGVIVKAITRFPPIGGNRAIFTDECSPKSPKHCLQCSEQWAIFTDRWKSRDFYRWKSPQIARPFPIPETITSSFWNIQSNGRFWPIGGNRAIFSDEFPPTLPNHLPSQRLSHIPFAMFRAMDDFHRSVEIARFFSDECFPQIAKQFATPEIVTDFFRNVQRNSRFSPIGGNRAIFTDECSPNRQDIPITKTITDVFCNVQSNGRFSPIGGNRDFYRWNSSNCQVISHPRDFLEMFKAMGRFSPIGWIARHLPMNFPPHCQTICHPKDRHTCLLQCSEQWAIFTDRWKACHFYRWIFPTKCRTICHPKDRHRFLLGPEIPRTKKKSHRNRDRFATKSPATCQIWRDGRQPSLLGPGGWGRPTLPRGTSQFCVCTSSAQCSDSFFEDRNLPK